MKITLAVLADYANVTRENKLNIMGIFDRIAVAKFPAMHSEMQLVLRLEAQYAESDRPHTIDIRLHDPDGEKIFEIKGDFVPRGGQPGETLGANQIIRINNLPLRKDGGHTVSIFVDNDLKSQVALRVEQLERGTPRERSQEN